MSKNSQIRSATEEDLLRHFGSGGFVIGIPVRPKPEHEHEDVVVSDDESGTEDSE